MKLKIGEKIYDLVPKFVAYTGFFVGVVLGYGIDRVICSLWGW